MSLDWDIEELACKMLGKTDEETEEIIESNRELDNLLYDKYDVGFATYAQIVEDLLPFTPVVNTAFGGRYHAFVKDGVCIVKKEVKE